MSKIPNAFIAKQTAGMAAAIFALAAFLLLLPSTATAVGKWDKLPNGHTVQDYYGPVNRKFLDLVNAFHMRPKEQLHNKSVRTYHVGDIEYVLRHIPNHPLALRRATITCTQHPDLLKCSTVDEDFKKAVDWDPKQPNTRVLYGVFLQLLEKEDEALEQYELALRLKPDMPDAHYNLALIYYKREDWAKAAEHAKVAYANGHRAPGLRRKLNEKGLM